MERYFEPPKQIPTQDFKCKLCEGGMRAEPKDLVPTTSGSGRGEIVYWKFICPWCGYKNICIQLPDGEFKDFNRKLFFT